MEPVPWWDELSLDDAIALAKRELDAGLGLADALPVSSRDRVVVEAKVTELRDRLLELLLARDTALRPRLDDPAGDDSGSQGGPAGARGGTLE